MKKYEQEILAFVIPVVLAIVYLTFFGDEMSWSENALREFNSLLNATLAGIMAVFLIEAYNHPKRELEVYKWWGTEIRFKNLCKLVAFGFYTILIFSLNSILPEWLHMVATGISVTGLAVLVSGWYKTWSLYWWVFSSAIILSGLALAVAFAFRWIDVKYPEFALAIISLVFLYKIRR